MSPALDQWFIDEILVHEEALLRYLRRCGAREDAHDLRQDVYARVYDAARKGRPAQARAFLFASARNLLADRARRARVVSIEPMGDFEPSHVLVDDVSPERWCGGRQLLHRLADAFDALPDRCREAVWLRRVEDLPQKDVAMRMGISEKTVEKHLAKGMRLLADRLYGSEGAASAAPAADRDDGAVRSDDERQHAD